MKTYKNLYPQIIDFPNLLRAAKKAQSCKRFETPTGKFNVNLEKELLALQRELDPLGEDTQGGDRSAELRSAISPQQSCGLRENEATYQPKPYHSFYIYEPKPRMISAAPYRDRVVHHALCNIIAPILEKSLIFDTYANRQGKGTHAAILRYQFFAKQYNYVLKCDIKKFFPSIDHAILKALLRKKIACPHTLCLIDKIIDNSNEQEAIHEYFPQDDLFTPFERRRGLPIGNLTSQLWGNYYLNEFDHFVKEKLGCKGYLRYVDDFVIFADEKEQLHEIMQGIKDFLVGFRLVLHPKKCQILPTSDGVSLLGHRLFPFFRLLKKENARRAAKRFRKLNERWQCGLVSGEEILIKVQSWLAHAKFSYTFRLREKIISEFWRQ